MWQAHLSDLSKLVHTMADTLFASCEPAIQAACESLALNVFCLDGREMRDRETTFYHFARVLNYPDCPPNWDAVSDLLMDLSWHTHCGAVVILKNASVIPLVAEERSKLFETLRASAEYWRDEPGEYNERSSAVPFHVLVVGSPAAAQEVAQYLPGAAVCEHR